MYSRIHSPWRQFWFLRGGPSLLLLRTRTSYEEGIVGIDDGEVIRDNGRNSARVLRREAVDCFDCQARPVADYRHELYPSDPIPLNWND